MTKLLWNKAEIRNELYGVWNEVQELQNEHLSMVAKFKSEHQPTCPSCKYQNGMKAGVNRAIHRFGGRPRR